MLIELTIGNFKSFRDKTSLSMIAANLTSEDSALDRDNVIPVTKNLQLLKTAALYGANASGKSNLGAALRVMRRFVLESAREATTPRLVGVEPFLLDRETITQPSLFEMVFLIAGTQYRYGFEVNHTQVMSEWLFHVPKTKEVALFVREGQEIRRGPGFPEGKGLEVRTRPEALFLSVTALFNGTVAQRVQGWFSSLAATTGLQDEDFRESTLTYLRDPERKKEIVALLQALGLDIVNLNVTSPLSEDMFNGEWPDGVKQALIAQATDKIVAVHYMYGKSPFSELENILGPQKVVTQFEIDLQESQGTRKLIAMAGPLLSILREGHVLFVDELDARLHPLLTRRIIELFHSPLTNPMGAQLIFATHDSNLLDKSLFRRDQIWFAEKDPQGVTHLASLAEYRVRNGAAFEKNYLEGRYGAIPFLGDLDRLPWTVPSLHIDQEDSVPEAEPVHA